jgi:hypothetical protein
MQGTVRARVWGLLLFGGSALFAVGCGSGSDPQPPPKTYPAKGQVVSRKAGPLTDGLVQFETTGDKPVSVQGHIQSDGQFKLVTLHGKQKIDGAPEGSYRVSVVPPQTDQQEPPVSVGTVFQVKPDGPNDFKIEIP